MATYSFQDIVGSITGPGGTIPIGSGSGAGEGGITITASADKNVMMIGADGSGMNSLIADSSVEVKVTLLKTSPVNAFLQQMYNYQVGSSLTHGQNTISFADVARGDLIVCSNAAFKKQPELTYAKEGGEVEWSFDAISSSVTLGTGTPEL
jgi:hypothetical protein